MPVSIFPLCVCAVCVCCVCVCVCLCVSFKTFPRYVRRLVCCLPLFVSLMYPLWLVKNDVLVFTCLSIIVCHLGSVLYSQFIVITLKIYQMLY